MRKNDTTRQPSLFVNKVPQPPEGYYSSGPNPNLRRFVEEHSTPYDPATDDYDAPPFDKPITSTKATAIYNMHTYWSKKPHDAIREYIRHYTKPGDLVLDPFCGSGGTALAALMEGRKAIAIDLSPAATFITKNYCTPVDVDALQRAFEELEAKVKPELDWLYETRCDRCDGRATTAYTVYSYRYQCPRCLEKVPLFDCVEVQGETAKGKPRKKTVCPYCYERGHIEEISTSSAHRFGPIPVLTAYECEEGCVPKRQTRQHNDRDEKKREYFRLYDAAKLTEIEKKSIPHWYPDAELAEAIPYRMLFKQDFRSDATTRLVHFFDKRNLWALSAIREAADEAEQFHYTLQFSLTAILFNASMMYRYRSSLKGGFQMGTYYLPPQSQVINVWSAYERKMQAITSGLQEIPLEVDIHISTQSATDLSEIPENSLDYIFTDPPYADKVQYGELNFLWEAWLDLNGKWYEKEVIVNKVRGKTDNDWQRLMCESMTECYRVLKPGRWLSLCYHDTSEGTWHLVQDLMTEVGFIPENTEQALYIDTGQKSFNQLMADKVNRRDLVINFRKPRPYEIPDQLALFANEDEKTFREKGRGILHHELTEHPGSPADRLYDVLVSRAVREGIFERHDFDALLREVAEVVDGRWYLLETADQVDTAESHREEAAAAHLEAFMRTYLELSPTAVGVHYSDLFEQYLPYTNKPRRLMQHWLPEFFFKTSEGTWRPPADEEERAQKAALRASGALRRIKRFGNALLDGVPPAERDRPENVSTAADWIRQCRRAGLYELGRALYEKGGFDFAALDAEAQLEVEEDYQLCVRRS